MTRDEEKRIVEKWMEGRKWGRCGTCDQIVTFGQDRARLYAVTAEKVRVECGPCIDDKEEER